MYPRHGRDGVTSRLRLRGHDYAEPASYFVTICIEQRHCLLGTVQHDTVEPSPAGTMAGQHWQEIPARFPGAEITASVLMPNHLHGVIDIGLGGDVNRVAPTCLPNLSRIMQWFKSATTLAYARGVKEQGWPRFPKRLWQEGFHDHIIRDDRDLSRILTYMETNPSTWPQDDMYILPEEMGQLRD